MGCVNQGQRAAGKGGLGSLQGRGPQTTALRADEGEKGVPQGPSKAYPGHLDPVLHHPGPVPGRHSPVPQAGGDDAIGHTVELGDRGADSGSQVFLALLVPLGPDGSQAVVGHHLLEQLLGDQGERHLALPRPSSATPVSLVPGRVPGQGWSSGKAEDVARASQARGGGRASGLCSPPTVGAQRTSDPDDTRAAKSVWHFQTPTLTHCKHQKLAHSCAHQAAPSAPPSWLRSPHPVQMHAHRGRSTHRLCLP